MRIRTVFFILAALIVVGFTLLNWTAFTRPTPLSLGFTVVNAPLGLVLLGLLAAVLVIALALGASARTRQLLESRQHAKALQAQRELAERAEASRFVDLRQFMENHLRESRQRETNSSAEIEQTLSRIQRELRNQIEQLHRVMAMRLGEMEARMTSHLEHLEHGEPPEADQAPMEVPAKVQVASLDRVK